MHIEMSLHQRSMHIMKDGLEPFHLVVTLVAHPVGRSTFQGNSHLSRHLPAPQQSVFSDTSLHNFRYGIDCDASDVQE